jgi:hypothetical protein
MTLWLNRFIRITSLLQCLDEQEHSDGRAETEVGRLLEPSTTSTRQLQCEVPTVLLVVLLH